MLAVLNRYRVFFIILSLILLAILLWMVITGLDKDKVPSRGVFVLAGSVKNTITEGRSF